MSSIPIVLSDPRMLAEFVRQSEFKAFFEKRFAVPPDYAALLFKNGELMDAFKGGHFSVGGLVDKIKSIVGGSTHISMMIADLKPFNIQTAIKATSRDNVDIAGVVSLEIQVDPDKPSNILGMMQGITRGASDEVGPGRRALAKATVLERIKPHLTDRVFEAGIGQMDAVDLRGNIGFQDKLQADMMLEVERVVGDLGLIVRAASVEWTQNAEEASLAAQQDAKRQQDALDFQLDLAKRAAERQQDATEFTIQSELELAKLENATEDELKMMALNSEITFIDAREGAKRRQEIEEMEHQIKVLEVERKATFENAVANARNKTELLKIEQDQFRIDTEMAAMRDTHLREMKKSGMFDELEVSALAQRQQREHIAGLSEIELRGEQVRSEIKRLEKREEREHEERMLKLKAGMSPEQILATDAGLSSDVAAVLAERARAETSSNEERMSLMREMVEAATAGQIRSETQAREMFAIGMQGGVGIAAGAGGGNAAPVTGGVADAQPATIDCPKCSTTAKATSRFCLKCGHKLRT